MRGERSLRKGGEGWEGGEVVRKRFSYLIKIYCTSPVYSIPYTYCTVPKVIDFPRYKMKCCEENVILPGICHVVSHFPLLFMLYRGNLDCFSNSAPLTIPSLSLTSSSTSVHRSKRTVSRDLQYLIFSSITPMPLTAASMLICWRNLQCVGSVRIYPMLLNHVSLMFGYQIICCLWFTKE